MTRELELGRVVLSIAGRDAGKTFVVCELSDGFAFVSDGKYHRTTKLKKKNIKHITTKPYICDTISQGYVPGEVTDAAIRRFLREIKSCEYSCKEE